MPLRFVSRLGLALLLALSGCVTVYQPLVSLQRPAVINPELIGRYDNTFKLLRQAAHAQVACDWGLDLSAGPELLLPSLGKAKGVAQTARLRVMWHLQHGRPTEARDDLLAAFTLGFGQDGLRGW